MNAIVKLRSSERKKLPALNVGESFPSITTECSKNPHIGSGKGHNTRRFEFDVRAILQRADGDRDLLPHLVRSLSAQWQGHLADLARAAKRRDAAALQISASRLKRSFASVGARSAGKVAEELEQVGERNALGEASTLLEQLRMDVDRLEKLLAQYVKTA